MKEAGGEHLKKTSFLYYNEELELFIGTGLYEIDYTNKKLYPLTSFTDPGKLQHYINVIQTTECGVVSEA